MSFTIDTNDFVNSRKWELFFKRSFIHKSLCSHKSLQNMAKIVLNAMKDGPCIVTVDGQKVAALCRCGASNNKPRCDGTHAKVGFKADEAQIEV